MLRAGTDGGSVVLVDPAVLPKDFADRPGQEVELAYLKLVDSGSAYVASLGDGDFRLHLYENEEIPGNLLRCSSEVELLERFPVPSGMLHFLGAEYLVAANTGTSTGSMTLRAGHYRLVVHQMEYPVDEVKRALETRLTPRERFVADLLSGFPLLALAILVATITLGWALRGAGLLWLVLGWGFFVFVPYFLMAKSHLAREIRRKRQETREDHPELLGSLTFLAPPEGARLPQKRSGCGAPLSGG